MAADSMDVHENPARHCHSQKVRNYHLFHKVKNYDSQTKEEKRSAGSDYSLNCFFSVFPTDGERFFVDDVECKSDDTQLRTLVESIWTGFVAPMQSQTGRTPQSTPSHDQNWENLVDNILSEDF
ncbi:hypothetical protein N7456_001215 [Penicillium angulare]|uniref:Uncharacterized protein n=1 Tax=Penicillium angulare TaxID=116970 RepID=A0A9W9KRN2_9EURO|nr:hypothetical protein N7456_001215 [Penicillium angulare]